MPDRYEKFWWYETKIETMLLTELYGLCCTVYSVDIWVYNVNLAKLFRCCYLCKQSNCTLNFEILDLTM